MKVIIIVIIVIIFFSPRSKLFHVRPVTQTDVYRADAKEIPRIFQVGLSQHHLVSGAGPCVECQTADSSLTLTLIVSSAHHR